MQSAVCGIFEQNCFVSLVIFRRYTKLASCQPPSQRLLLKKNCRHLNIGNE